MNGLLRYDLLCIEGISRALRVFLQKDQTPHYKMSFPPGGESSLLTVTCSPDVRSPLLKLPLHLWVRKTIKVRPYFACAILRNVTFTPRSYASFIDLQEKLHQNLCRRRQLVAIGTHDLDTIKGPFRYEARPPRDIKFVPLGKDLAYNAEELMTLYEVYSKLSCS